MFFILCVQEIIKEPSQSGAEEVESEGRKPDGGQGADVRSEWAHRHGGQDERCRRKHSQALNHTYVLSFVDVLLSLGNVVLFWHLISTHKIQTTLNCLVLLLGAALRNHNVWVTARCPSSPAEEVHSLLKALVLFQFDRQAEKLQLAYEEALQMMEAAVPEVWPEGLQNSQAPVIGTHSYL